MSENQLREAYTLMKQGDKKNAARLVQELLREDRNNVQAWWLFSHILEDEEKTVKSLEKVLALNPDHPGARKRLSELRPEYAHLSQASREGKEKAKNIDASRYYWDKLHQPRPAPKSSLGVWSMVILLIVFICGAIAFFNILGASFSEEETDMPVANPTRSILDRMDNTPESVAAAYTEAFYREDVATLRAITCADYKAVLEEDIENFEFLDPHNISVNLARTRFDIVESSSKQATVSIRGTTVVSRGGGVYTIDWSELPRIGGYDYNGIDLQEVEGNWLICN